MSPKYDPDLQFIHDNWHRLTEWQKTIFFLKFWFGVTKGKIRRRYQKFVIRWIEINLGIDDPKMRALIQTWRTAWRRTSIYLNLRLDIAEARARKFSKRLALQWIQFVTGAKQP